MMAFFRLGGLCFWPLFLTLLYVTSVTSIFINFETEAPTTFWVDSSCLRRGFTSTSVQESLNIAKRGASRLLNLNDGYQGFVFQLLFKVARDFSVMGEEWAPAWNAVETLGWVGAMTIGNNRDTADVRIYCDNDQRWTLVPDDPVQIAAGLTANSQRTSGDDAEYEDAVNFMRRSTDNIGCEQEGTLGVTYSADSFDMDGFTPEPANYHSPRQTITICDLAFTSAINKFSRIPAGAWASMQMDALNLIPTFVLLHQLVSLQPYDLGQETDLNQATPETWGDAIGLTAEFAEIVPAPYVWNAVLAYVADLGWGVSALLTQAQYIAGRNLFRYSQGLINVPFVRGGPITLPTWLSLPVDEWPQPS